LPTVSAGSSPCKAYNVIIQKTKFMLVLTNQVTIANIWFLFLFLAHEAKLVTDEIVIVFAPKQGYYSAMV
jgi:hypothetical protein